MNIKQILESTEFRRVVEKMKGDQQRLVMGKSTTPEAREKALQKFHLIEDLLAEMAAT